MKRFIISKILSYKKISQPTLQTPKIPHEKQTNKNSYPTLPNTKKLGYRAFLPSPNGIINFPIFFLEITKFTGLLLWFKSHLAFWFSDVSQRD